MATVHNPTRSATLCHPLHKVIKPHGTVQVTNEEARLISTAVFIVTLDEEPETEVKTQRKVKKNTTGVKGVVLEDKGMTLSGTGEGVVEHLEGDE